MTDSKKAIMVKKPRKVEQMKETRALSARKQKHKMSVEEREYQKFRKKLLKKLEKERNKNLPKFTCSSCGNCEDGRCLKINNRPVDINFNKCLNHTNYTKIQVETKLKIVQSATITELKQATEVEEISVS